MNTSKIKTIGRYHNTFAQVEGVVTRFAGPNGDERGYSWRYPASQYGGRVDVSLREVVYMLFAILKSYVR